MEGAAGQKRSPEVVDLWADSDSDDDVVEVVAVSKPPKKARKEPLNESTQKASNENASGRPKSSKASLKTDSTTTSSGTQVASLKQANNGPASSCQFNVATYNVWFGPNDQAPAIMSLSDDRMMALAQELFQRNKAQTPLWFIGFQEVTPLLWASLKPLLESVGYRLFLQEFQGHYGCAIAVLQTPDDNGGRLKIISHGWQPYRSTIQNRGFLHVRAQLPHSNQQVLFTTTHLESFMRSMGGDMFGAGGQPYTGVPERKQQIQELETFCLNHQKRFHLSMAMISGDLNWDDERERSKGQDEVLTSVLSSKEWKDSWFDIRNKRRRAVAERNGKVTKKNEPRCFSYDTKENAMLGGSIRRRFDRVLVRTNGTADVKVKDAELIGTEPIEGLTWHKETSWNGKVTRKVVPVLPSDHFGYVVTLVATAGSD